MKGADKSNKSSGIKKLFAKLVKKKSRDKAVVKQDDDWTRLSGSTPPTNCHRENQSHVDYVDGSVTEGRVDEGVASGGSVSGRQEVVEHVNRGDAYSSRISESSSKRAPWPLPPPKGSRDTQRVTLKGQSPGHGSQGAVSAPLQQGSSPHRKYSDKDLKRLKKVQSFLDEVSLSRSPSLVGSSLGSNSDQPGTSTSKQSPRSPNVQSLSDSSDVREKSSPKNEDLSDGITVVGGLTGQLASVSRALSSTPVYINTSSSIFTQSPCVELNYTADLSCDKTSKPSNVAGEPKLNKEPTVPSMTTPDLVYSGNNRQNSPKERTEIATILSLEEDKPDDHSSQKDARVNPKGSPVYRTGEPGTMNSSRLLNYHPSSSAVPPVVNNALQLPLVRRNPGLLRRNAKDTQKKLQTPHEVLQGKRGNRLKMTSSLSSSSPPPLVANRPLGSHVHRPKALQATPALPDTLALFPRTTYVTPCVLNTMTSLPASGIAANITSVSAQDMTDSTAFPTTASSVLAGASGISSTAPTNVLPASVLSPRVTSSVRTTIVPSPHRTNLITTPSILAPSSQQTTANVTDPIADSLLQTSRVTSALTVTQTAFSPNNQQTDSSVSRALPTSTRSIPISTKAPVQTGLCAPIVRATGIVTPLPPSASTSSTSPNPVMETSSVSLVISVTPPVLSQASSSMASSSSSSSSSVSLFRLADGSALRMNGSPQVSPAYHSIDTLTLSPRGANHALSPMSPSNSLGRRHSLALLEHTPTTLTHRRPSLDSVMTDILLSECESCNRDINRSCSGQNLPHTPQYAEGAVERLTSEKSKPVALVTPNIRMIDTLPRTLSRNLPPAVTPIAAPQAFTPDQQSIGGASPTPSQVVGSTLPNMTIEPHIMLTQSLNEHDPLNQGHPQTESGNPPSLIPIQTPTNNGQVVSLLELPSTPVQHNLVPTRLQVTPVQSLGSNSNSHENVPAELYYFHQLQQYQLQQQQQIEQELLQLEQRREIELFSTNPMDDFLLNNHNVSPTPSSSSTLILTSINPHGELSPQELQAIRADESTLPVRNVTNQNPRGSSQEDRRRRRRRRSDRPGPGDSGSSVSRSPSRPSLRALYVEPGGQATPSDVALMESSVTSSGGLFRRTRSAPRRIRQGVGCAAVDPQPVGREAIQETEVEAPHSDTEDERNGDRLSYVKSLLIGVPGVLIVSRRRGRLIIYLSRDRPNVEGVVRFMFEHDVAPSEYSCQVLPWQFRTNNPTLPSQASTLTAKS